MGYVPPSFEEFQDPEKLIARADRIRRQTAFILWFTAIIVTVLLLISLVGAV